MTNIIIVDDKAENLYLLELLLKGRGYNTISAKNGAEALDLARKDIPNLIISDILMPVMDGFTLCREVKKDKKLYNIPFIFYTATYTDPKDEEFALSLGADRFLLKPLDLKEFIAIVKTVLKEAKKKNIQRIEVPPTAEEVILKEYNEALVRKLEDKMLQTEQAEKEVRKYNIALLREIEEHKRAVEALKKQKDEFETIFNLVPAQIWYKDTHNNFIRVNRQVCTDIGMTNDKIEGHSAEELFPSFAQQYFKDDLEVFNTRKPKLGITEKVNTADGEIRWVLSDKVPVLGNDGEVNGLIAVVQDITERKRTEEKIRETQILLQASIESPKDMIILSIDKNYNYLYYNSVHENFVRTAYGKDLKIGVNLLDCITNDDDRRKAKINYDKALNGFSHATVAEYGDLERYHYETRYNPIYNDKKEIIGATAFSANITERKQMEEKLRESEELFRHSFDYAATGICIVGTDGKFQKINKVFKEMIGYEEDELKSFTFSDITHVDDLSIGLDEFKKMLDGEIDSTSFEKRYVRKDKQIIWVYVSTSLVRNVNHQPQFFITQVIDITERKRAEEALTYERNLLKALMDNTTDHIYIKDSENRFIRISKAHANIFGLSDPAEAIGKTDFDFFTDEHARSAYDAELEIMKTGKPVVDLEEKETWPDGRMTWVSTTKVPLRDINGKVFGTFGVSRDITERKHILEELMIAKEKAEQSDKLKTEFLAQMSHEIRTPLNAIVGSADYLNDLFGNKMDADTRNCFAGINLASARMIRTVDLILNAAELQTCGYKPHLVKVDLNSEILYKLFLEYQLSAKQKGIQFSYTCKEKETNVTVDVYSVIQIFANLIDNAVKYTNKGQVEIHLGKNISGNIFVEVKDTGIGMSKAFLPIMFEPFVQEEQGYTRSYEGNGLGLTLVKKYCELNNATIEVESEKNVGSAFRIIFDKKVSEAQK